MSIDPKSQKAPNSKEQDMTQTYEYIRPHIEVAKNLCCGAIYGDSFPQRRFNTTVCNHEYVSPSSI
ncbi:hypothetical protein CaCOL14_003826 [Colletotrichum acutatum]